MAEMLGRIAGCIGIVALVFHFGQMHKVTRWLRWPSLIIGGIQTITVIAVLLMDPPSGQTKAEAEWLQQSKARAWLPPEAVLVFGIFGVGAFFLITTEQKERRAAAEDKD